MKSVLVKITCIVMIVYGALFIYGQYNAQQARKKWEEKKLLLLTKDPTTEQDWPQQRQEFKSKIVAQPEIKTNTSAKTVSSIPLKQTPSKIENVQNQITKAYPKIEKTTQEIAKKAWSQLATKTSQTKKATEQIFKQIRVKDDPSLVSKVNLKKEFLNTKKVVKKTVYQTSHQPAVKISVPNNYIIDKDIIYDKAIMEATYDLPRGNMEYVVVEYNH